MGDYSTDEDEEMYIDGSVSIDEDLLASDDEDDEEGSDGDEEGSEEEEEEGEESEEDEEEDDEDDEEFDEEDSHDEDEIPPNGFVGASGGKAMNYSEDEESEEEGSEEEDDDQEETDDDSEEKEEEEDDTDDEFDKLVPTYTGETIPEDEYEENDSELGENKVVVKPTKEENEREDRRAMAVCVACCCLILVGVGAALYFYLFQVDNEVASLSTIVPTVAPPNAAVPTNTPANEVVTPSPVSPPTPPPVANIVPTLSPTEAPTIPFQSVIIVAVGADTSIRDGDFSGASYGTEDSLLVRNGGEGLYSSKALLSFDLGALPEEDDILVSPSVILQLQHIVSIAGSVSNITVVQLPATPLIIEALSWDIYQPTDLTDGPTFEVAPSDSLVEVDITELVMAQRRQRRRKLHLRHMQETSDQLLLMLEARGERNDEGGVEFRSREYMNGASTPELVVTYPTPAPTSAPGNGTIAIPPECWPGNNETMLVGNETMSGNSTIPGNKNITGLCPPQPPSGNETERPPMQNGTMPVNGTTETPPPPILGNDTAPVNGTVTPPPPTPGNETKPVNGTTGTPLPPPILGNGTMPVNGTGTPLPPPMPGNGTMPINGTETPPPNITGNGTMPVVNGTGTPPPPLLQNGTIPGNGTGTPPPPGI